MYLVEDADATILYPFENTKIWSALLIDLYATGIASR